LQNIENVKHDFGISGNSSLLSIEHLDKLKSIGGGLSITSNENLQSIQSLESLDSIGGNLIITENPQIGNVDAFLNLKRIDKSLFVFDNMNLSECCGLKYLLDNQQISIGEIIIINNNASNCNSKEEILQDTSPICLVNTKEDYIHSFRVFPNPFNEQIEVLVDNEEVIKLRLYNLSGREVNNKYNLPIIDTEFLTPGVYILEVLMKNGKWITERVIKN